jgi:methionyl-tRNA formyltransferase
MAEAGAPLMAESLRKLERGTIAPTPQDASQATYAPKLEKEHGHINWTRTAQDIYNRIRGLAPWPGAYTTFRNQMIHVWGRPAAAGKTDGPAPGALLASGTALFVASGEGTRLELEAVQIEGRKRIAAREFLNGARLKPGERFGE